MGQDGTLSPGQHCKWLGFWLQRSSLVAQTVKNLPVTQETQVRSCPRSQLFLWKSPSGRATDQRAWDTLCLTCIPLNCFPERYQLLQGLQQQRRLFPHIHVNTVIFYFFFSFVFFSCKLFLIFVHLSAWTSYCSVFITVLQITIFDCVLQSLYRLKFF